MTSMELDALASGIAPVLREIVTKQSEALLGRLVALEERVSALPKPERGEKGEAGSKGDPGESIIGPVGLTGPEGARGARGASIFTGIGSPSFDGDPGDAYLDVKTGDIYQWR